MLGEAPNEADAAASPRPQEICAVIVTYNIGPEVHRCFNSIQGQVGHVLIVDNASDEATQLELKHLAGSGVTLIFNQRNEGIAHAYNQAVQWARSAGFQWILLLDHDSEATPGMVENLAAIYATLARQGIHNVGVVGSNPFDVNIRHYLHYGPWRPGAIPVEDDVEAISSGSLIPLSIFDQIGPFNEDLFIYYVDIDFCRRLTRAGFRVYICMNAVLLHKEGTKIVHRFLWRTAKYDHYSKEARYYLMRNAIYLFRKGILRSDDLPWVFGRYWKDHLKILIFDKRRFTVLGFSLRGLIDGLRGKVGPIAS